MFSNAYCSNLIFFVLTNDSPVEGQITTATHELLESHAHVLGARRKLFGDGPAPLAPEGGRPPGGALPAHVLELGHEPHDWVTQKGREEVVYPAFEKSARHPFSPVCVDSTLPARAEPGEQFKLARLARPQASASCFVIFCLFILGGHT